MALHLFSSCVMKIYYYLLLLLAAKVSNNKREQHSLENYFRKTDDDLRVMDLINNVYLENRQIFLVKFLVLIKPFLSYLL